ncbi:hypothetical protein EIB18_00840 [Caulobacter vibrioides]|uniref:Uncharacterized protein n=1 Tax=Caulobacter vibrioides (strain NA1000 / CB15N) TaxID=565050 RepID=A0A0H3J406_CAUVN|nr:hypothetical protein [Caulobacter vibrioides]YP_009020486.1 hypothetical protein CCNA_03915 [Caulobacter vibrioides NA1000]AHI88517.1 hypothetical protein CCNA_03915 [Caulobacter vibrioides NA1000]ATC23183.2 hypothetical protein CA608_00850 [Caulobacter vibrioides]ATC27000.2 hypothetical protein CA607_00840 [Caulobacter vibrioides]AZH14745.1 hypothetical protein EIB18_00840 [Caulobacter vibrioides]PLR13299.1 hypothetical protein CVUC_07410 [Caulobacter vibrioides]
MMIDAKLSFAPIESVSARRLPPLAGLALAAVLSAGLWALLAVAIAQLV